MRRFGVKALARPLVSSVYSLKRRYRIGDAFLDRHPALANRLMGLLTPFKATEVTDVHGHVLRVDPGDYLGLTITREYEPEVTRYAKRVVRPGATVLDIGANIGYFTLLFAKLAGPDGVVHAFEPAPANVALLRTNVASNGYHNVVVHPVAVGERTGHGRLGLSAENPGDHRLVTDEDARAAVDVEVVAIDAVLPGIGPDLSLVKLDIQGAEPLALAGMWETLRTARTAAIVCEYTIGQLDTVIGSVDEPDTLLGLGYELCMLEPDGSTRSASLDAVRAHVAHGGHLNVALERRLSESD